MNSRKRMSTPVWDYFADMTSTDQSAPAGQEWSVVTHRGTQASITLVDIFDNEITWNDVAAKEEIVGRWKTIKAGTGLTRVYAGRPSA